MRTTLLRPLSGIVLAAALFLPHHADAAATAYAKSVSGFLIKTSNGELWYVAPTNMKRSPVRDEVEMSRMFYASAQKITAVIAKKIPTKESGKAGTAFSKKYAGKILLVAGDENRLWYVSRDGVRTYFDGSKTSYDFFAQLGVASTDTDIAQIMIAGTPTQTLQCKNSSCLLWGVRGKRDAAATVKGTLSNMMGVDITSVSKQHFSVSDAAYTWKSTVLSNQAKMNAAFAQKLRSQGMTEEQVKTTGEQMKKASLMLVGSTTTCTTTDYVSVLEYATTMATGGTQTMKNATCTTVGKDGKPLPTSF